MIKTLEAQIGQFLLGVIVLFILLLNHCVSSFVSKSIYLNISALTGVLISPEPNQEGNKLGSMSGTREISTTSRRKPSSSPPYPLQGKAPKEIQAVLTDKLACFLPGRAKDLSVPL